MERQVGWIIVECVLWQGAARGVQPALSLGVYAVDDAVDSVCCHDVAEQDEL